MASRETASPPSPPSLPSSKVSCLACRIAKRRCSAKDIQTACQRCLAHGLSCEFKQHRRGRRKRRMGSDLPQQETLESASVPAVTGARWTPVSPPYTSDEYPGGPYAVVDESAARAPRGISLGNTASDPCEMSTSRQTRPEGAFNEQSVLERDTRPPEQHAQRSHHPVQFSHLVPGGGRSAPYLANPSSLRHSVVHRQARRGRGEDDSQSTMLYHLLRTEYKDPVQLGIVKDDDVATLIDFFFSKLNPVIPFLDPHLHLPAENLKQRSSLLYTAVLAASCCMVRPQLSRSCLLLADRMLGQAVEENVSSIEVIQAILILAQWKLPEESSSWPRVGYAIRLAQDQRLGLSAAEKTREGFNRERTWLNLVVADYHLAIHHSLPRMLLDAEGEGIEWFDHITANECAVPGDEVLGPLLEFSRLCRAFADALSCVNGDEANLRLLQRIESQWSHWRKRTDRSTHSPTLKACDAYFRFHLAEYRLVYCFRRGGNTDLTVPIGNCVDAALGVCAVFLNDIARAGRASHCFNLCWVSLAVCSVWLATNAALMLPDEQTAVTQAFVDIQTQVSETKQSDGDMPAYVDRLLQHLGKRVVNPRPPTRAPSPMQARQVCQSGLDSLAQAAVGAGPNETIQAFYTQGPVATVEGTDADSPQQEWGSDSLPIDHHYTDFLPLDQPFPPSDDEFWRLLLPAAP